METTVTLKDADRYLLNGGFECKSSKDLGGQFEAKYEFGNLNATPPRGVTVTLHDYGDEHWSFDQVWHSEDLTERAQKTMNALRKMPGFEALRV